jgi:AcrR family transcriptional regulator
MRPRASDRSRGDTAKPGPAEIRERIGEAALLVAGEQGYQEAGVRQVLRRYGGYRAQFYKYFSSFADCYEQGYAAEAERLCEKLLTASRRHGNWQADLEAALCVLAELVTERPELARGMLLEVHAAGEPSLSKRREVLERLSRAIDSARRETGSRHSSPPLTAMFIVHVIDAALIDALIRGTPERFSPEELTELAAIYYDLASSRAENAVD